MPRKFPVHTKYTHALSLQPSLARPNPLRPNSQRRARQNPGRPGQARPVPSRPVHHAISCNTTQHNIIQYGASPFAYRARAGRFPHKTHTMPLCLVCAHLCVCVCTQLYLAWLLRSEHSLPGIRHSAQYYPRRVPEEEGLSKLVSVAVAGCTCSCGCGCTSSWSGS